MRQGLARRRARAAWYVACGLTVALSLFIMFQFGAAAREPLASAPSEPLARVASGGREREPLPPAVPDGAPRRELVRAFVGVSLDLMPGVRVSVTGKETEARVLRNLARLRERKLRVGGIAVIAKHTAPHVRFIYRFFRAQRLSLRVLPLFRGPEQRPYDAFGLSDDAIVAALETLFECWMEDDERIPITPFADYFEVTLRALSGARIAEYDRARQGDGVLLVNTNGDLYCTADAYVTERRLGNVFQQSYDEIVQSDAHALSLLREAERREQTCGGCRFRGACSTWPVFETRSEEGADGRCSIASRCYTFMGDWLRRRGFDEGALAQMLASGSVA